MKYLNQLEYPDMPYLTDTDHPDSELSTGGTVLKAGCGLCSACMVVDRLTAEKFSLEECIELSVSTGANHGKGTDMKLLAPALAHRFRLILHTSSDVNELRECLQLGGCAIVNVGGDRERYTGTFSKGGHYILALSCTDQEICILDPSYTADKYLDEPRASRIRAEDIWIYCSPEVIARDAANRTPSFYLFRRAADLP